MGILLDDIRIGLRLLAKSPLSTSAAVLTLALAIGANTAIFSVVNAAILRPLPYADSERLVEIRAALPSIGARVLPMSPPEFADVRDRSHVFEDVAAYGTSSVNLTGEGAPERVVTTYASASLIPMLGVRPVVGRSFTTDEDREGYDRVAVLGYGLWQRRFAGIPGIVGHSIHVDGIAYTIVGVMPADFRFPNRDTELWVPIAFSTHQYSDDERGSHWLSVLARLGPNVTEQQASAELRSIANDVRVEHPTFYHDDSGWTMTATGLKTVVVGDARQALLVLLAAVGLILLIGCANVANLTLARATARSREIALRTALGASRWRIIRQMLTEGVLLSMVGGAIGVLFAVWIDTLLIAIKPDRIPRYEELDLDWRVLAFTLGVSLLAGVLFTLVPALVASRSNVNDALKDGSRGTSEGPGHNRFRAALVVSEIALAVIVLVGAGLLIRSLDRLLHVSPGFDPQNVATMRVAPTEASYPDPGRQRAFYTALLEKIRSAPGVESAAAVNYLPLGGSTSRRSFAIDGVGDAVVNVEFRMVSPGYFETMEIPIREGRSLASTDREGAPLVVVVNESMVRTFFPGADPIGRRIKLGGMETPYPWMQIVGVAGDVRHRGLDEEAPPEMYVSYLQPQLPDFEIGPMFVAVRSVGGPGHVAGAMTDAVHGLDPELPVYDVKTMEDRIGSSVAGRWFDMLSLASLAAVALLLAVVGLYSVLAYAVSRRVHEIGIRMALGASPGDILKSVLERGALLVAAGLAIGIASAAALSRYLTSLLFQVEPTDAWTFLGVSGLLAAVALAACYLPARSATNVDPLVALRHD